MSQPDQRALQRRALGFFSYWSKGDKAQTAKGRDVQNLAEQYQQMTPDQKSKFLQEFFCGKSNKDAKGYLEQKMQTLLQQALHRKSSG